MNFNQKQHTPGFCNWLVKERRASTSPVAHLAKLNDRTDKKRKRRAFLPDELGRLLTAAKAGPRRFGVSGPERAVIYRLAAESGLRASELRSLTGASFDLDSAEPTVTVAAAYSKHRRDDTLPLRPDTAVELREFLAKKLPTAPAFDMPKSDKTAKMIRADLSAAREDWISEATDGAEHQEREQSSFLAYHDDAGRVADFHALRHTFASNLAAGDVHPKTAQELLRHSTIC